jgi:hypothetical protein
VFTSAQPRLNANRSTWSSVTSAIEAVVRAITQSLVADEFANSVVGSDQPTAPPNRARPIQPPSAR